MLSQRSMQRIRRAHPGLPGLALLGFFALGCGQSEGGRCQVDSDCKSGLECTQRETGNGVCRQPGTGPEKPTPDASPDQAPADAEVEPDGAQPDAAAEYDTNASPDQAPAAAEVEPDDAQPDTAAEYDTNASPDQTPAAGEVGVDGAQPDAAAATQTDASASEAGAVDAMELG